MEKLCFFFIKLTVANQIEILDRKIERDEAQFDLVRKAAKITILYSGNMDKCEHLVGEDLNYRPNTVEQAQLDYSPLTKCFKDF